MKTFIEQTISRTNEYLSKSMQEKKFEIVMDSPSDVMEIPIQVKLVNIEQYVVTENYILSGDEVHVFEQTFEFVMEDQSTFQEVFCSFGSEDIEDNMLPKNESVVYYYDNDGSYYAGLYKEEERERNIGEKTGQFLLEKLEYPSFFEDEDIKYELQVCFQEEATKNLSSKVLPYFPFVTSLIHDGGSQVVMHFSNETFFYISYAELMQQWRRISDKENLNI